MLKRGKHSKIVSERLGHANIGITLDTYSHALPDMRGGRRPGLGAIRRRTACSRAIAGRHKAPWCSRGLILWLDFATFRGEPRRTRTYNPLIKSWILQIMFCITTSAASRAVRNPAKIQRISSAPIRGVRGRPPTLQYGCSTSDHHRGAILSWLKHRSPRCVSRDRGVGRLLDRAPLLLACRSDGLARTAVPPSTVATRRSPPRGSPEPTGSAGDTSSVARARPSGVPCLHLLGENPSDERHNQPWS